MLLDEDPDGFFTQLLSLKGLCLQVEAQLRSTSEQLVKVPDTGLKAVGLGGKIAGAFGPALGASSQFNRADAETLRLFTSELFELVREVGGSRHAKSLDADVDGMQPTLT
jgi:hypothetical protein